MKYQRHMKILELVQNEAIETQEQLLDRLCANGFSVTQATVSRDIKELRLFKRLDKSGRSRYDVENAAEDILENPVYVILNLCRVAAYLRDGMILSKKAGGEWGLAYLSERYHPILRAALTAYTAADRYRGIQKLEQQFANEMLAEIFR